MAQHDLRSGNQTQKSRLSPDRAFTWLLCTCAVLTLSAAAQAGQITIIWNPRSEATVVGYKIHNAVSGQPFSTPVDVGNVSSFTLTGLNAALAYHAAVSAYDILGQESPRSAEVVYNPRPDGGTGVDSDQDGLPDSLEVAGCTNPNDADSDDDGIPDGIEDASHDGVRDAGETNPCAADSDGDGLQDGTELGYTLALVGPATDPAVFRPDLDPATATDPLNPDTDGDGLTDGSEDLNANGCVDAGETDPLVPDNPLLFADDFSDGTSAGDPSWKRISGTWSVSGTYKRYSSTSAPVSVALVADPKLNDLRSGRIESTTILTPTATTTPNARIIFHYKDATHFRYVRLTAKGLSIGQAGSNPIEKAGVKARLRRSSKVNVEHQLRVDIAGGTDVQVYLDGSETPLLSYKFKVSSSGRVGYRTDQARSLFDNTAVRTDAVLLQ